MLKLLVGTISTYGLVIWKSAPFVDFKTITPSLPNLSRNNLQQNSILNQWIILEHLQQLSKLGNARRNQHLFIPR